MDNDAEASQTGPDIKKMLRIHHPDVRKTSLSPGRRAMKGISLHGLTRSHILADDFAQLGQAIDMRKVAVIDRAGEDQIKIDE